jgi:mRNA-degrading endonuclease RelE of RelBE toxin-antitoxin system
MNVRYTDRFERQYRALSEQLKAKVDKQIHFLMENVRHPSLRAKKYDEAREIWQARIDRRYRFYFQVQSDTYILLSVIPHPK